jgi:hypothetical protein
MATLLPKSVTSSALLVSRGIPTVTFSRNFEHKYTIVGPLQNKMRLIIKKAIYGELEK